MEEVQILTSPLEKNSITKYPLITSRLSRWIFERMEPSMKGRMIELCSDAGIIAPTCLQQGLSLHLGCDNEMYRAKYLQQFADNSGIKEILSVEIHDLSFISSHGRLLNAFNTVITLTKGGSILDNPYAMTNCNSLLKHGGYLLIVLPAQNALFEELDQGLNDWRKYNHLNIKRILKGDYEIIRTRYFTVLNDSNLQPSIKAMDKINLSFQPVSDYHKRVVIFNKLDTGILNLEGLSVLVVAKKK